MTEPLGERLTLDPVSSSPAAARQWLNRELADCSEDLIADAVLLLTELVTNAVLHAQTRLDIVVGFRGTGIRVEVTDASPVLPTAKGYGADAATGRGLQLVDALAERWGIAALPGGKVVWFELGGEGGDALRESAEGRSSGGRTPSLSAVIPPPAAGSESEPPLVGIRLLGASVPLIHRTSEHYDALMREFRLIAEHHPDDAAVPARLVALVDELSGRYSGFTPSVDSELAAAQQRGDPEIDLHLRLPPDVGPASARYDEMLDEADAWCRAGELLTLAAPAEVLAMRKWLLLEIVRQVGGSPPVEWRRSIWAAALRRSP